MDYGNIITISRGVETPNQLSTQQNLITALMQHPDFAEELYTAYPYYSLLSTTSAFQTMAPEYTFDNHKNYFVYGRSDNPLSYTGYNSGDGANFQTFQVGFNEDYGQPNQMIRFPDGTVAQIQGKPVQSGSTWIYTLKLDTNDATAIWDSSLFNPGDKAGVATGVFGEGSQRGYGTIQYPDLLTNYTTITRYARSVTRSAASSVTWLQMGDARFWIGDDAQGFYNAFAGLDGGFLYQKEKWFWDAITNVNSSGQSSGRDPQTGNVMYIGNGFKQQISNTMSRTYNIATFTESWIQDALAQFVYNAGLASATIDVHTGSGGYSLFQKAMKLYMRDKVRYNSGINEIREAKVGERVSVYFINDAEITVYKNPILSDPNWYTALDGQTGFPLESFNFYLIERGMEDGIPTIQKVVRNANGINSSMIISEVPGMLNRNGVSSTGFDGKTFEFLSEDMLIVRKPNRIGRWIRTA